MVTISKTKMAIHSKKMSPIEYSLIFTF